MLHDMPKSRSTALIADPEDAVGAVAGSHAGSPPAKASRRSPAPRVKIVRQSALGALLRPIGISIALILSAYALVSLGTTFYRSYYRHLDNTAPVHADKRVFEIFFGDKSMPHHADDLVIRDDNYH